MGRISNQRDFSDKIEIQFEKSLDYNGYSYLTIFGTHINGGFIAIPNWGIACEADDDGNISYNRERLTEAGLNEDAADAISRYIYEWINGEGSPSAMLGRDYVIEGSENSNYENQILIVKPSALIDEYQDSKYQYFYAISGFGCHPDTLGTSVSGKFLYDDGDERSIMKRSDFLGIADPDRLPDWVKEKYNEINEPVLLTEQDNGRR